MPAHHSTTSPLVGRDADLDHLAGLLGLDRGADGGPRSGMVLLAGDAGVGKTRVLVELARRAEQAGWQVLAGHCLDFGDSALPYLPFTEMLGRLAHRSEALSEALAEAHPAVRHLQPGRRLLAGPASADEETMERAELFEAVHAVFERLAAAAPLLVVVEDTHWADRSTRDLLSFLFTRPFTGPVSLLVSYRSDDLHRRHPLRATTAQWSRVPGLHRVVLGPLSDTAVRSLVRSLHTSPMPAAEVRAIVERAEGNAFFVEELVAATELGGSTLPEDLADLLLVRLDQLDDAGRLVVRAAACAGRQVSHALLAAVVDLAPDDLDRALRSAVESNVLVPGGANSYAFRHALLAEAVYDDLLPGERVRIHAAYAVALRSHKVDGTAAELARHARAAHDLVTAVTASIEAGDDAMSVGGPDEAARHYETALELLGNAANRPAELGDVDLVSLTARASDAMLASGDLHRALSLVQDQLAHLPADAPVTDRVTLLMTLGLAAIMGDTPVNALEVTSEAMALLPVEPTRLRARLMAAHAWANAEWQRDEEAMRWAQDARELGGRLGLRRVVADATTTIARLEERAGNPEESKRVFEKIVAQARTDGDVHAELRGLHHLGGLHFEAGQFAEAQRYYSRAVLRAAETNRPWSPYGFDTRVMGAIAAYITGDWDEVARIVDVTGEAPPELIEVSLAAIGLGVAAGRGDADALRTFQRVRPWWDKDGVVAIYSGAAAIDLYADSGDYKSAIRVYEEVVDSVTALWQVSTFLARFRLSGLLLGQLATCGTRLGTTERAELVRTGDRLLDAVRTTRRRAADRGRRIGPEGLAWTARVEAEHLRLRWLTGVDSPPEDELVGAWRETVAAFTRLGHVFELARSRARLSAVLRSLGQTAEARELADQAREVARRLGAEPLLVELRVHGAGRRTDDRARATEVLTPREQEILALVAEGRSNAEIARQLYISAKTVSVHVSNILAKLGAAGRTEAVAVARRRGLLAD